MNRRSCVPKGTQERLLLNVWKRDQIAALAMASSKSLVPAKTSLE